ncbi:MAG: pantoate--beta-alanine ligase [Chloroflexota bacterium]|nr:pantoate--beta-alanine ligase [Chloroflexota bacterium]
MPIVTTRAKLRHAIAGEAPGLVPTLGALHAGHQELIARSAAENRLTVVSIFVNPTQFQSPADLARYPRDLDRDAHLSAEAGADLVFAPRVADIYLPGAATSVDVDALTRLWEGASRPGHFRGVATVVTILLNLVRPGRAYFGEKDYQQLQVVKRLHADLALPGEIVACPTVREADGLALSSRNARLSMTGRRQAAALPRALRLMRELAGGGTGDTDTIRRAGLAELRTAPDLVVDYLAVVDGATLDPIPRIIPGARALAAVILDEVRLIDNAALAPGPETEGGERDGLRD